MSTTAEMVEVTLQIPAALRRFTENRREIVLSGHTVGDVLQALVARFPALEKHLFTEEGSLRSFVNLYLEGEDIRYLQGLETPLKAGARLALIPSIAGGKNHA